MDKVNRLLRNVFPTLEAGEYITIVRINDSKTEEIRCKTIDEVVNYCARKDKYFYNTYYTLSTTDGLGRATSNLKSRACLCWDFDKKDLGQDFNVKDILHLFKSIRLYYHAIIDTGHGYHVYVFIEPTTDLEAVEAVQKAVAIRLNADIKATLKTQLMRLPGTVNIKDNNKLPVKIVYLADDEKIKRLPIAHYQYNYVTERYKTNNTNISWAMRDDRLPQCVRDILERGSKIGERNADLQILVVALKRLGKSEAEIRAIVSEWLENTEKMEDLDYQLHYMYENLYNGCLNCKDCPHRSECYVRETVVKPPDYPVLKIPDRDLLKIKNSRIKKKGKKYMNGNMLIIYSILLRHNKGLFKDELTEELTYKNPEKGIKAKCCMSDKTIRTTLKELEENGFIVVTTIDRKKFYKAKPNYVKDDMKTEISYLAALQCIKGCISTQELELYCYIKYLNKMAPKKKGQDPYSIYINQEGLANVLGIDQSRISKMIKNLLNEKLMSIDYRSKSSNNNFMYNVYLLNC